MSSKNKKKIIWKVKSSGEVFPLIAKKKYISDNLNAISRRLIRRLIKLANFPDTSYCDKWASEVYQLLHNISKLPNGKLPSAEFILANTYFVSESLINCWDKTIVYDYIEVMGPSKVELNGANSKEQEIKSRIYEYMYKVAITLAYDGELSRSDCLYYINKYVRCCENVEYKMLEDNT